MLFTAALLEEDFLWNIDSTGATCHTAKSTLGLLKDLFGERLIGNVYGSFFESLFTLELRLVFKKACIQK